MGIGQFVARLVAIGAPMHAPAIVRGSAFSKGDTPKGVSEMDAVEKVKAIRAVGYECKSFSRKSCHKYSVVVEFRVQVCVTVLGEPIVFLTDWHRTLSKCVEEAYKTLEGRGLFRLAEEVGGG